MTDSNEPQKPISTDSESLTADNSARSLRSQMQPALPTPEEMVAHLDGRIIGHGAAKKMLAVACYEHLMQCATVDLMGGKVWPDNHSIITGPSGCGKSAMIEALGAFLGIPVLQIDCSNLTPHGYKGRDLSQYFDTFAEKISDEDCTRPAIVVWEEIDKLSCYRDPVAGQYRTMVQADALRFLDGAVCGGDGYLDASRILSIGCGAFDGLDEFRDPERKPEIGFGRIARSRSGSGCIESLPEILPEHLVKYGLLPEFVGRFSRLAALAPLDAAAMRKVLVDAEASVLKRRIAFFRMHAVELDFTDDAIDELVSMAIEHPTGVRSLRLVLDRVLAEVEFRLPNLAAQGVIGIALDRRAVRGEVPPVESNSVHGRVPDSLLAVRKRAGCYRGKVDPTQKDGLSIW